MKYSAENTHINPGKDHGLRKAVFKDTGASCSVSESVLAKASTKTILETCNLKFDKMFVFPGLKLKEELVMWW